MGANELYDDNKHISFKGFEYYFDNNVEEAMATTVAGLEDKVCEEGIVFNRFFHFVGIITGDYDF